tara:strand:+ start:164 stop:460 length:297 start_codon:yes stop_codon:yes gene_type:complete
MPSFLLSETNDRFEIRVLDGTSVDDGIFDELSPAVESGTGTVVMDFEGVPFVNAVFLSTLGKLQKALERKDRKVVLKNLSVEMNELLQVVDFRVETEI